MSRVFAARDPDSGVIFALKLLRDEHRLRPDLVARFVNEALPIRDLMHPALPLIFACEVPEDGAPYIAMELLHGSLWDRLQRGRLPPRVAVSIAGQLAAALAHVHAHGIVHRDVTPRNVLFATPPGSPDPVSVKLVDFGLAKWPGEGPLPSLPVSTAGDDSLGTPEYMAPEQALSAKTATSSADVYALGVLLFELCAGHRPFSADTTGRLRLLHLMAPPPALPDPDPQGRLGLLVAAMLDKDRARRPSAADLAPILTRLADEIPG